MQWLRPVEAVMCVWYRSGLEGYCKVGGEMLGDRGSVLSLCQDLLPGRTQGTLARTWTLSKMRRGTSNRPSLFESYWLGDLEPARGTVVETYRAEALAFAGGNVPEGGFATIELGTGYAQELQAVAEEVAAQRLRAAAERRIIAELIGKRTAYLATRRCAADAIERCVGKIIELSTPEAEDRAFLQGGEAVPAASVTSLVMTDGFLDGFTRRIIPAITDGLECERYASVAIEGFARKLEDLAQQLTVGEDGEEDGERLDQFREFLTVLVAGIIYGPDHPLVVAGTPYPTEHFDPYFGESYEPQGTDIRLTQVFDERGCSAGYSELFHSGQVVFVGRSTDAEEYMARCRDMFEGVPATLEVLDSCEKSVFPVASTHASVSGLHGMLLCEEGVWRLYDLGSTNGTSVRGLVAQDVAPGGVRNVQPGDFLSFGAPANANDANVYWDAVTLMLARHVSREEELL